MRNRIIAAALLAAVLVTGLGGALASPGSAGDPFVTLSYLTGTYYAEMEQAMLEQAQKGTAQIEKNALDKLAELSGSYLDKANRDGLYSDKFLRLTLARNEALILPAGSSLQFDSGRVALTFSSGCLIDATSGTVVDSTGTLTAGRHYIAAENTSCTVTALSDAVYLSVCGYYDLELTGIKYTPFTDIVAPAWYADSVLYAYEEGLVNGMTETTFEPTTTVNRAMLATLLFRMAGVQGTPTDAGFTDVPTGKWYSDAVNWANSVSIVTGYPDGSFQPMTTLTREQLAVILYRYTANYLGESAPLAGDLTRFPDAGQAHGYARDALSWAVGIGLIKGRDTGLLDPLGNANRAEIATVLQRFNTLFPY